MSITSYFRSRRDDKDCANLAKLIRWSFRDACIGAGVALPVDAPVAGTMWHAPEVTMVDLRGPVVLTVRMLPGQEPAQLARVGRLVAPYIGGVMLRVEPRGHGWCLVTVLTEDPLDGVVPPFARVPSVDCPIYLGTDEEGNAVPIHLPSAMHLIGQGASGGGKSVGCYGLLGQLGDAPDVRVVGTDITDILLWPWAERQPNDPLIATGTKNPAHHVEVLERIVAEMDERIAARRRGYDSVTLDQFPLMLVVAEEVPGLYRLLKAEDRRLGRDSKLEARAKTAMSRILAEGRKALQRVLLITQRADADVVGGYERGQASHVFSYRIDSLSGLRMLHADVTTEQAAEHSTAAPGIALFSAPGVPLVRLRSPYTHYSAYCRALGVEIDEAEK